MSICQKINSEILSLKKRFCALFINDFQRDERFFGILFQNLNNIVSAFGLAMTVIYSHNMGGNKPCLTSSLCAFCPSLATTSLRPLRKLLTPLAVKKLSNRKAKRTKKTKRLNENIKHLLTIKELFNA